MVVDRLRTDLLNKLINARIDLAAAAVCLMSGHHDCPTFIAVNADKLENCLTTLTLSIQSLKAHSPLTQV
ncbi:hypothetical protein EFE47_10565 [Salmonella enterica]|nr:hypothetical protein [Salmonella enterica]MMW51745.1 hypothetical protein [Salmonella enterica]